jgi:hypothetical protein
MYPKSLSIISIVKFFPFWLYSIRKGSDPLSDEQPWITFPAIDFIKKIISKEMIVYEFGTGGSTLFFANRAKKIISVEHDPLWMEKISNAIKKRGYNNWQGNLIEPIKDNEFYKKDPSNPDDYISSSKDFLGMSFEKYVRKLDEFPDNYFDIIFIDGRARPSCFKHSLPKLKTNGYIFWDNTDRNHYFHSMNRASTDLVFFDFPGCCPYVNFFTRTSAWKSQNIK